MKRDYLSYSALKAFAKSPNHYLQYVNKEHTETPAMVLGSLTHCLVLEPEQFAAKFAVAPKVDRRTNSGKALWAAFEHESEGRAVVTEEMYHNAAAITDAVSRNSLAYRILIGKQSEHAIEGEIDGIPFKGIADAMDARTVVDLKTCQDASPEGFRRAASNFSYHLQAAIYLQLTGCQEYYWIAVESAAPYNVSVYRPTPLSIGAASAYLSQLIERFKAWDGKPKGYGENIYDLDLPPWHPANQAWENPSAPVLDNNDNEFNSFIDSL